MADCGSFDLACKAKQAVTDAAVGVFAQVCQAFADAGAAVLKEVASAFLTTSTINLASAGISRVYLITSSIGMTIALLLLLGQIARSVLTMRGEYMAHAVLGVFKAALATGSVFAVTTLLLQASDEISARILVATFGSAQAFSDRFAHAIVFTGLTQGPTPGAVVTPVALLLLFGGVAMIVGALLFVEMVFRHAAVVVLVASAPIGASGLVAGSTTGWWRKFVSATIQLIFLKPVIVLCFAIGFGVAGESEDVLGVLAGLTTLLVAAVAWPLIAKFFTWTAGHVSSSGGAAAFMGGLLGSAAEDVAGRMMSSQSGGSSLESDQATITRNNAVIDEGLTSSGGSSAMGGGGSAGGAAAAGEGAAAGGSAAAASGGAGAAAGGGAAAAGGGAAAGAAGGPVGLAVVGALQAGKAAAGAVKDHASSSVDDMAGHADLGAAGVPGAQPMDRGGDPGGDSSGISDEPTYEGSGPPDSYDAGGAPQSSGVSSADINDTQEIPLVRPSTPDASATPPPTGA